MIDGITYYNSLLAYRTRITSESLVPIIVFPTAVV